MKFAKRAISSIFLISDRAFIVSGMSSLALRLGGLAASFGLGVLLARALGPAEFGIYGLVIALSALAMNLALLGTPQLAVREFAAKSVGGDWADIRSLAKSYLLATTSASIIISILAVIGTIAFAARDPNALRYCFMGIALSATMTVTALIAAELRGLGSMTRGQFIDIFGRPALALGLTGLLSPSAQASPQRRPS